METKRGITPIRMLNKDSFEKLFENFCGFESAYLGMSEYGVWGATNTRSSQILEVFLDVSALGEHVIIHADGKSGKLFWETSEEFDSLLCLIFDIFYESDNDENFKAHSSQHQAFNGFARMPWLTPDIIIIHVEARDDRGEVHFTLMENLHTYVPVDEEPPSEYIQRCLDNFKSFKVELDKEFDKSGHYIGSEGPIKHKDYKPKN